MPPPNRLARPLTNSLAYSVPVPLEPGMMRPAPAAFNPRRELENLSIGMGRGLVTGMEGTKQLLTQPVATAQALIEAARQLGTDPAVILDMLRAARQKAMSGSLGLGELLGENVTPGMRGRQVPAMRELDVYHGTPHRFPATEANPLGEFDASKIGTGEGAQAYGHGVYFAEAPDVAKMYRSSNDPIARKAEMLLQSSDGDVSRAMRYAQKKVKDLEKNRDVKGFFSPVALEQNKGALEYLKRIKSGKTPEIGSLYKADLPDEMIDRMLDWDKRISDQPKSVRVAWQSWQQTKEAQKLKKQLLARGNTQAEIDKMFANPTGETAHGWIYEGYGSSKGGEKPKVAKFLQSQGVLGVKYQDAGSRGQGGTGTRNFVVFPGEEKKVRILERK